MTLVNFSYLTVCLLKFLQSETINFRGQRFLHYLVTQLETLKFAADWNKIGRESGWEEIQRQVCEGCLPSLYCPGGTRFRKCISWRHKGVSLVQVTLTKNHYAQELPTGDVQKGSYLWDIFLNFNWLIQFGLPVLLDPIWEIDNIVHCTKTFQVTWPAFHFCSRWLLWIMM